MKKRAVCMQPGGMSPKMNNRTNDKAGRDGKRRGQTVAEVGPLAVGNVTYRNNVLLAPMSGVSDVPFRRAAWALGAGMVISEMVASEALVTGHAEMQVKSESAGLPLHVVQLAGREARWMDHAARLCEANGADVIDINMGCPARKVTNGLSGSALMRDPAHALELVEAVVNAVKVPVTLKMRLGWDHQSINAPELAKRAVEAGVQLITVHGRTRQQFYRGDADWEAVAAVRDTIDVPLVVNGDILDAGTALDAMRASGADGVMIGRASYGRPDLPGAVAAALGGLPRIPGGYDMAEHYAEIIAFYGVEHGVRCARKHVGWWFDRLGAPLDSGLKAAIMTSHDPGFVLSQIEDIARSFADPGPLVFQPGQSERRAA